MPMAGVLRDVRHALGVCVHACRPMLAAMMEADCELLCGPKGRPDADRLASAEGRREEVVLGGQRMTINRARVRAVDAVEISLPSFQWAPDALDGPAQ